MLAVDISFLAVPTVQNQTAAIIAAYLSTLCAMGSLMVSLVLAGQVNDTRRNNAEGVVRFFLSTVLYSFMPTRPRSWTKCRSLYSSLRALLSCLVFHLHS